MPGRKIGMARKATRLESAVLKLYRKIDDMTPEIHKETERRHGVTAPTSPWVAVYRLACELLLATAELGHHYRIETLDPALGPIMEAIGARRLAEIRRKYQRGLSGRTLEEIARSKAAAEEAYDLLPDAADATEDFTWAMINQHVECPDFKSAPSNTAIGLWFTLESSGVGFKAAMYSNYWNKQLPKGDWAVKDQPVVQREPTMSAAEEEEACRQLQIRLGVIAV